MPPDNRVPVDSADAAWLRMDRAENRMVIVAVMTFDAPMAAEDLVRLLHERIEPFQRFRCRVRRSGGRLDWEIDPLFNVTRHVTTHELPRGSGETELQAHVGDLMNLALPEDRPPWHFEMIPHYRDGSALVARLHHGIADGIALVRVLLSLADGGEKCSQPPAEGPDDRGLLEFAGDAVRGVVEMAGALVEESVALVMKPDRAFLRARQGVGIAAALGKFALIPPDSPTPFKAPLSTTKRVAWSRAARLPEVKRVARRLGGTVNDVLLAALAGGLHRFLATRGPVAADCEIRAMVPVNLRPPDEPLTLGNRFGLVLLSLPVGLVDPRQRFAEVRTRMDRLKRSMEPAVALGILQTIGASPQFVQDQVVRSLSSAASAVMTNVPGPNKPLHFAGRRLEELMFWVPRAGSIGLGISIISYVDDILLGFAVDASHVSDPHELVEAYEAEWHAMSSTAMDRSAGVRQ